MSEKTFTIRKCDMPNCDVSQQIASDDQERVFNIDFVSVRVGGDSTVTQNATIWTGHLCGQCQHSMRMRIAAAVAPEPRIRGQYTAQCEGIVK